MAMQIVESTVIIRQRVDICKGPGLKCNEANRVVATTPHVFPRGSARATELTGGASLVQPAEYLHYVGDIGSRDLAKPIGFRPPTARGVYGAANIPELNRGGWGIKGSVLYEKIEHRARGLSYALEKYAVGRPSALVHFKVQRAAVFKPTGWRYQWPDIRGAAREKWVSSSY